MCSITRGVADRLTNVILHHADTVHCLVVVKLLPLSCSQGRLVVAPTHVVGNLSGNDDASIVASSSGVESGKCNTSLRNCHNLVGNTISVQPRGGRLSSCSIADENQDLGVNIAVEARRCRAACWRGSTRGSDDSSRRGD